MKFNERKDFTESGKKEDQSIECVFVDDEEEYIVQKHAVSDNSDFVCRLTIKRSDREPIRAWRVLQDIKNAIMGEKSVAIEIYPKESEVTDTGNLYHLWVFRPRTGLSCTSIPSFTRLSISYQEPINFFLLTLPLTHNVIFSYTSLP